LNIHQNIGHKIGKDSTMRADCLIKGEAHYLDEECEGEGDEDMRTSSALNAGQDYYRGLAARIYPHGTFMRCPKCGEEFEMKTQFLSKLFDRCNFPPPCPYCRQLLQLAGRRDAETPATIPYAGTKLQNSFH
jgi:hypothetical protein